MAGRLAKAEVAFTNAVLHAQLQDLMVAFPDPSAAMVQILGASAGSAPPTPKKKQHPMQHQQQRQQPGPAPATNSFELDLAEFEKELDAAAAAKSNQHGKENNITSLSAQPNPADQKQEWIPAASEREISMEQRTDAVMYDNGSIPMPQPSASQFSAQAANIHVLNERVQMLEGIAEDAKRSAAEAKRSLAATKRAASTQIEEAQAQGQAQVVTLEERIKSLQELNEQLEHDKAIFIDAHAVLKSRLGATEDEKCSVQQELQAAQEGSAAMCAEIDRLRASVEELVTQSATSSGGGVAHATVGSGLRRANSAIAGERAHLSMEPTTSNASSNGESSADVAAANAAVAMGKEPRGTGGTTREHRRSLVAVSLRPGF